MMKLKSIGVLIPFSLFALSSFAQTWDAVKSSGVYLYGEGWGNTVAEADKGAISDLISKISVQVSSDVSNKEFEHFTNNGIEVNNSFRSVVNTYSAATLTNTEKVIIENEPNAHVGRWIKRSEISKIFDGRKNKISDYISSALKAEKKGKIDVALKDLYWALALTRTLQYPNEFRYEDDDCMSVLPITWIPRQMKEIMSQLNTQVVKHSGDVVELFITYKGKPVNSVDYTFFDGRDWSNIYSANDGVGMLELAPGNNPSHYPLKFEYEYQAESHIDKEVENVLNSVSGISISEAYKSIQADVVNPTGYKSSEGLANSFTSVSESIYRMPESISDDSLYRGVIIKLAIAIENKRYDDAAPFLTPEAKDIFNQLIKYGKSKIIGHPEYRLYRYGNNVILRGLQMSFSFGSGMRKSFVEEVVFSFDKNGLIDNISFGLGKTAEADILGRGTWDDKARFAIMNFLENYQTAYALKRLDYISSVFDDDAVIITGTVCKAPTQKVRVGDAQGMSFGQDIIKYNRHTKDSYLKQLAKSFASKEYINLRLADNEVRKLGKGGELYAIQISQEYYSSNYGDKGYLFLMVDINDPEKPIIKVRTWQPEKDPEFGIYGPEHFK